MTHPLAKADVVDYELFVGSMKDVDMSKTALVVDKISHVFLEATNSPDEAIKKSGDLELVNKLRFKIAMEKGKILSVGDYSPKDLQNEFLNKLPSGCFFIHWTDVPQVYGAYVMQTDSWGKPMLEVLLSLKRLPYFTRLAVEIDKGQNASSHIAAIINGVIPHHMKFISESDLPVMYMLPYREYDPLDDLGSDIDLRSNAKDLIRIYCEVLRRTISCLINIPTQSEMG